MYRHPESNPHFLPRQHDPVIEFPPQSPHNVLPRHPPRHHSRTSIEPPHGPRPQPPHHGPRPQPHPKPLPPHQIEMPPHPPHQESRPHFASELDSHPPSGRGQHHSHHRPSYLHTPTSRKTRPIAWLVAAFCALFWVIVIVGGIIILIVYLVFRPRSPWFDISTATMNAAYLDMGYLLNADVTVLVNFTNPNTKVNVDFRYAILDLYFENNFIATRYIEPFSVMRGESRFSDVHMMVSQVRMSTGRSLELQKQIGEGRVRFEIKGLFRTRSKLGGIFQYSYWLYAHCKIVVTAPPIGVLIRKECVTKR